ncbi:four-carbon acid sugar kinase family protein [Streptomyces sp. DASNCL29]|uniref:four-carbon acid sugar kinase family protein n=1 Tax=Streptomyces sp. DASNCL29 TaxID=2583819 RepID=UPI00110FA3AA|nr:four-carbon acid sugar kinase family protein [Streptomyces sp. DASNCL29]TMU89888.1 four-carbon acid sugar kinase family protein [Streptomyces sp. DASNCL29]
MSRSGRVADGFTGATGLRGDPAATGRRVAVSIGPSHRIPAGTDAAVVALETPSAPPEDTDDRSPVRAAHAAHGVVAGLRAPHRTVRTFGHDEYAELRP